MATYTGSYSSILAVASATVTLTGTVTVGSGVALDATNPPQTIVTTTDAYIGNGGSAGGDIGVNLQAGDVLLNAARIRGGGIAVQIAGGG